MIGLNFFISTGIIQIFFVFELFIHFFITYICMHDLIQNHETA